MVFILLSVTFVLGPRDFLTLGLVGLGNAGFVAVGLVVAGFGVGT